MLPMPAPVVVVQENLGGDLFAISAQVSEYLRRRVTVRIEGDCASACTMLAALPSSRLCVGPNARLAFHQAFWSFSGSPAEVVNRSEAGTAELMRHYPARLKAWIRGRGGLGPKLILLQGARLRSLFRACAPMNTDPAIGTADPVTSDVQGQGRLDHSSRWGGPDLPENPHDGPGPAPGPRKRVEQP